MAKSVHDNVLDGGLNVVKMGARQQIACSAEPTTYAQATGTYSLAVGTMATGTDYAIADDSSGRKCTISAKNGVTAINSGTATHVALVDTGAGLLLYVTTCTPQYIAPGNTVNFGSWKFNLQDPT